MAVALKRVAVVRLPVKDLEASANWYRDTLGIPLSFDLNPGDNEAWFDIGELGLNLMLCPNVPKLDFTNMDGQAQPILVLQVDNIHSVYETFREKGIEVSEMFYAAGAGYSFNLRDLDGHLSNVWGGFLSANDEPNS